MNAVSNKYSKWLLNVSLSRKLYVTVWGYDSSVGVGENDTKLLVDHNDKIVLFDNEARLYEFIREGRLPLFDEQKMKEWTRESQLIVESNHTELAIIDLDSLADLIRTTDFNDPKEISAEVAKELVDFLNFVTDFGEQIAHKELMDLWENSSVHSFWEFMYDTYFWSIPAEELADRQGKLLAEYTGELCQQTLQRMLDLFIAHLHIY